MDTGSAIVWSGPASVGLLVGVGCVLIIIIAFLRWMRWLFVAISIISLALCIGVVVLQYRTDASTKQIALAWSERAAAAPAGTRPAPDPDERIALQGQRFTVRSINGRVLFLEGKAPAGLGIVYDASLQEERLLPRCGKGTLIRTGASYDDAAHPAWPVRDGDVVVFVANPGNHDWRLVNRGTAVPTVPIGGAKLELSSEGIRYVSWRSSDWIERRPSHYITVSRGGKGTAAWVIRSSSPAKDSFWRDLGFGYDSHSRPLSGILRFLNPRALEHATVYTAPNWLFVLVFAVLPAIALVHGVGKRMRRRRVREGHCEQCGYDLRATPNRCPECGAVPSWSTDRRKSDRRMEAR